MKGKVHLGKNQNPPYRATMLPSMIAASREQHEEHVEEIHQLRLELQQARIYVSLYHVTFR